MVYHLPMTEKEMISLLWEKLLSDVPGVDALLISQERDVIWFNKSAESWAGPLSAARGKKCYSHLDGAEKPHENCPIPKLAMTGKPQIDLVTEGDSQYLVITLDLGDGLTGHLYLDFKRLRPVESPTEKP